MHIPKLRYILTVLLALFGVAIWGFSTTKDSYAQTSPIKLFDAIPATGDTGEIFKSNLIVNFSSGRIILSGNDQGTGRMYVDDILYIRVTRPDSSIVTYTHFLDFNYSPVDLTDYFQIGSNQVRVRIENTGGPGEASAHWLVNLAPTPVPLPYQIVDEIPTAPVASGSFYARYFYVDYSGSGRMLLSADSNGQGIAP